jgi:tetratricopeptide (TPR) repeat protein
MLLQRKAAGWSSARDYEISETKRLARLAIKHGKEDAVALSTAGMGLGYVVGDLESASSLIDRALILNPNLAWAWMFSAHINAWRGESEVAIERATRAMRLSPHDSQMFAMQTATAVAHYFAGRYDEAPVCSMIHASLVPLDLWTPVLSGSSCNRQHAGVEVQSYHASSVNSFGGESCNHTGSARHIEHPLAGARRRPFD